MHLVPEPNPTKLTFFRRSQVSQYPPIWANAQIVASDTEALAAFKALEPLIPNIAVKGTPNGNFSISANYPSDDPDCWWTYSTCTQPKHTGIPADIVRCEENNVLGYTFDDGDFRFHFSIYRMS
jgi:hypothetical protein